MNQHEQQFADCTVECIAWLLEQLDAGKTDSGLCTPFHYWLTDRLQLPLSYTETQMQFVALCKQMRIKLEGTDEGFVYVRAL